MIYLKRNIDKTLFAWKQEQTRKPLLLRGARQVGKTSAIVHFATHFEYFVHVNLDESKAYRQLFEQTDDVERIIEQLSVLTNIPILPGRTLVFLDEIQTSAAALRKLRYFYEKMPNLHVIAAGSLLEFALEELPSFAAGRVRSLFMYPFSFEEFLIALQEERLAQAIVRANATNPLPDVLHQKAVELLKRFWIIGGMPEAIGAYAGGKSMLEVQRVLNDLILALQADFAKYKSRFPGGRLTEVFQAIGYQTGNKFTYTYPQSTLNHAQVKEAIRLLTQAGIVYPVMHSSGNGIPLGAETNPKKIKYLIFDTGIFQRVLGLDIGEMLLQRQWDMVNKGNIAELFAGLEFIKSTDPYEESHLYYWHRESKGSQAEVDFLIQKGRQIYPVEVKSGIRGSMQSLHVFLSEKKSPFGYRLSLENFSAMQSVKVVPLYAVRSLWERE
jgi:predicted AAA+ superfamily ATPase